MNRKTFSSILFGAFLIAFNASFSVAQKLEGNGNVVIQERYIGNFNKLELENVGDVVLTQGDKPSIRIEIDENLQYTVQVMNEKNTLEIEQLPGVKLKKVTKFVVYITVKNLKELEVENAGEIRCDNELKLDDLELSLTNVGKVSLELRVGDLAMKVKNSGDFTMKGHSKESKCYYSSCGNISMEDMPSKHLQIVTSKVGVVKVNAEKELTISHNSGGDFFYKGDAALTVKRIKDSGTLTKL